MWDAIGPTLYDYAIWNTCTIFELQQSSNCCEYISQINCQTYHQPFFLANSYQKA